MYLVSSFDMSLESLPEIEPGTPVHLGNSNGPIVGEVVSAEIVDDHLSVGMLIDSDTNLNAVQDEGLSLRPNLKKILNTFRVL